MTLFGYGLIVACGPVFVWMWRQNKKLALRLYLAEYIIDRSCNCESLRHNAETYEKLLKHQGLER